MDKYNEIREPEDLKELIDSAFYRAKRDGSKKGSTAIKKTAVAAAITVGLFGVGVNASPTFAAYVEDIPFVNKLAEFFKFDKGLEEAGRNGYLQVVDKSMKIDDIDVTIENLIYDNNRLVVKVSYARENNIEDISLASLKLKYSNGEDVGVYPMSISYVDEIEDRKIVLIDIRTTDVEFLEDEVFAYLKFSDFKGDRDKFIQSNEGIKIELNRELLNPLPAKHVSNEVIKEDGIEFKLEELMIYPTEANLSVDVTKNTDKFKFGGFTKTYILDGDGEKYTTNGASRIHEDGDRLVRFESNYFKTRKDMSLVIGGMYIERNQKYDFDINAGEETFETNLDYSIKLSHINKNDKGEIQSFELLIDDERLTNKNIKIHPLIEVSDLSVDGEPIELGSISMGMVSSEEEDKNRTVIIGLEKPIKGDNISFKINKLREYRELNKVIEIDN